MNPSPQRLPADSDAPAPINLGAAGINAPDRERLDDRAADGADQHNAPALESTALDAAPPRLRQVGASRTTLMAQVIATNALAIAALVFFAVLVLGVQKGLGERRAELVLLMASIAGALLLNMVILRRQFAPLEHLVATMDRIDLTAPGERADIPAAATEDIAELVEAFNRMIQRLETERQAKTRATVEAQESERARVARDLHDEANQALTAVILRLEAAAQSATPELAEEINEAKALAGQAMEELLEVVRRLRPTTLDIGLRNALSAHVTDFTDRTGIDADFIYEGESRHRLGDDRELAIYRVVQEALSNIVQHADASHVEVRLRVGDSIRLQVTDDGKGFDPTAPTRRFGVTGMRERALLMNGKIEINSKPGEGTKLTMELP
ncbi:MAG: sensor histidine kinase [Solirubrobacterales bacterium]